MSNTLSKHRFMKGLIKCPTALGTSMHNQDLLDRYNVGRGLVTTWSYLVVTGRSIQAGSTDAPANTR